MSIPRPARARRRRPTTVISATSGLRASPGTIRRSAPAAATRPKAIRAPSRPAWKGATMWSGRPLLAVLVFAALPATAAEDLRALEVRGLRGQSAEQARRDRYECHNWAVAQSGQSPPAAPVAAPPVDNKADLKHERIGRAIVGATIGGTIG